MFSEKKMNKFIKKSTLLVLMLMVGLSCYSKNDVKVKSFDLKSRPKPVFVKEQLGAKDSGLKAHMKLIDNSYHIFLQTDSDFDWDTLFPSGVENYRINIEFLTSELKKAAELQVSFADFVRVNEQEKNILLLEKKLSIGSDYKAFSVNYIILKLKGGKK